MKKCKNIIKIIFVLLMLIGCASQKDVNPAVDKELDKPEKPSEKVKVETVDLSSQKKIIQYLIGDWYYHYYHLDDITAKMSIDNDLNVKLSFTNTYSDSPQGDYVGKIKFDWAYVDEDETPDLIIIDLLDTEVSGGEFLFRHRTVYDQKRVLSLIPFSNENCIFEVVAPNNEFTTTPEEIMLEKKTNEESREATMKNSEFYAVVWGLGSDKQSLWLDDVMWNGYDDDYKGDYPQRLIMYDNNLLESVLYKINQKNKADVLGDEMPFGEVYFIKTNQDGDIISLIDAGRKDWIEASNEEGDLESEIITIMTDFEEIRKYLDLGMTLKFEGDYVDIDGEEFYEVVLGTEHSDKNFVREIFYAVNVNTKEVFEYDVINDEWIKVAKG